MTPISLKSFLRVLGRSWVGVGGAQERGKVALRLVMLTMGGRHLIAAGVNCLSPDHIQSDERNQEKASS